MLHCFFSHSTFSNHNTGPITLISNMFKVYSKCYFVTFAITVYFHIFSDSQLTRKAPSSYSDGVYKMSGESRPSARTLSQVFMKGKDGMASIRNRTAIATFFGKGSSINDVTQF